MPYAYVSNFGDGTVSVIDMERQGVVGTLLTGDQPFGVALAQDKKLLFVTLYNVGVVRVLDATYHEFSSQVGIAGVGGIGHSARGIALTPDGKRAYVTSARNGGISFGGTVVSTVLSGSVWLMDTTTFAVQELVGPAPSGFTGQALQNPYCVAAYAGSSGTRIYIADMGINLENLSGGLRVVDDANPQWGPLQPLILSASPLPFYNCAGVAVTPDGMVYVGNNGVFFNWNASWIELGPGSVTAARERSLIPPPWKISIGENTLPAGIATSLDGKTVYVALSGTNNIAAINTSSHSVSYSASVLNAPIGLTVTPDGEHLYAANSGANTVTVFSLPDLRAGPTITVGNGPCFVAM